MEPLTTPNPDKFSKALGMSFKGSNTNGKIWIFVGEGMDFIVEDDSEQLLHGRFSCPWLPSHILLSVVYAKCSRGERVALWEKMREITQVVEGMPWLIGGDFNTILSLRDRTGSDTKRQAEMVDFAEAIEDCRLLDRGYDGAEYTWAKNGLMERLDRVLISETTSQLFDAVRVTNLPRIASDHGPLLVRSRLPSNHEGGRAFRFQNMWVRHGGFNELVREDWMAPTDAEGLFNLKLKFARIKGALKRWNKEVFGNIHANLKNCEENIAEAQADFEGNASARNRMEVNKRIAEYILLLKMEEDFWKQKAALQWLEEGDKNTRFYQSWVKQKRIRLRIHKIIDNGRELTDDTDIKESAVSFFQNLLGPDYPELDEPDLSLLQRIPPSEHLDDLPKPLDDDEVNLPFLISRPIVHPGRMVSRPYSIKLAGASSDQTL
ncbi:uncharacterized protein LOC121749471 [Salvia splendens]|uniref:uncharacterized protein LOC121749471 n=1 Tax=Salvia splendens TaxID=180675 RepID=UPI001C257177|nr:uncharacterized protein LOC121749471 [Salvia splendens]